MASRNIIRVKRRYPFLWKVEHHGVGRAFHFLGWHEAIINADRLAHGTPVNGRTLVGSHSIEPDPELADAILQWRRDKAAFELWRDVNRA